ncbi:MAG: DUF47 family protein [Chloroflexi bacterium]|nr:DUF47 family protein [Chloroflexota bacterium]MCL5026145.1 DUF47 family protein [Chloroflexota bacterium]
MFEKASGNVLHTARLLQEMLEHYDDLENRVNAIVEREHEGDFITHTIIEQLNTTFITPFDREDIARLTSAMDDVVDRLEGAADAMVVYRIVEPTPEARRLSSIIVTSAEVLNMAMPLLRERSQMKRILEHCIEINRLENEADRVHRAALIGVFAEPKDAMDTLKWRDIYELLESATDRCEDVADALQALVMKHT